jgi:hypothetical protein
LLLRSWWVSRAFQTELRVKKKGLSRGFVQRTKRNREYLLFKKDVRLPLGISAIVRGGIESAMNANSEATIALVVGMFGQLAVD